METILLVTIGVFAGAFLVWMFLGRLARGTPDTEALHLIQQQMSELTKVLDGKLAEGHRHMQEAVRFQFSESQKLLREINEQMSRSLLDVTREQTKTNEATSRFMSIAEQLANLEKVLKHQKQRGNLGEASLELILSNMLPPGAYQMQYEFADKAKVDAVIMTKEGMIPVDAKFSLDNYQRVVDAIDERQRENCEREFKNDLKRRIDETAKYVRPDEGTLPFAFMFIPAEAIYYDLLVNEVGSVRVNTRNLIDYAYNEKKVIIVSPTTFAAYLQSVLYGFKAFKIEETAKDIMKRVDELGKHLRAYEEYMMKLGEHLGRAVGSYNMAYRELGKVDKDITRITGESPRLTPTLLERPHDEN